MGNLNFLVLFNKKKQYFEYRLSGRFEGRLQFGNPIGLREILYRDKGNPLGIREIKCLSIFNYENENQIENIFLYFNNNQKYCIM